MYQIKIGINIPQGTNIGEKCQFSVESVKRSVSPQVWGTCLLMGSSSSAGSLDADCKLGLTIIRPNLLSMPEMLSKCSDSHVVSALSFLVSIVLWLLFVLQILIVLLVIDYLPV